MCVSDHEYIQCHSMFRECWIKNAHNVKCGIRHIWLAWNLTINKQCTLFQSAKLSFVLYYTLCTILQLPWSKLCSLEFLILSSYLLFMVAMAPVHKSDAYFEYTEWVSFIHVDVPVLAYFFFSLAFFHFRAHVLFLHLFILFCFMCFFSVRFLVCFYAC